MNSGEHRSAPTVAAADYVGTSHLYPRRSICRTFRLSSAIEIAHEKCGRRWLCGIILGDFSHTLLLLQTLFVMQKQIFGWNGTVDVLITFLNKMHCLLMSRHLKSNTL